MQCHHEQSRTLHLQVSVKVASVAFLNNAEWYLSFFKSVVYLSVGGAQGPYSKSDPGVVSAEGGPPEPAQLLEGPGQ